jgi:DNA-binding YbaB/EbfC family protein
MKNLQNMMKQAQELQAKMADMQAKLAETEMEGVAGAGMVVVTLNGKGEMRKIKIDKQLVDPDDVETLEDLIVAATNTAKRRIEEHVSGEMSKMAGGLPLPPGMKLPF